MKDNGDFKEQSFVHDGNNVLNGIFILIWVKAWQNILEEWFLLHVPFGSFRNHGAAWLYGFYGNQDSIRAPANNIHTSMAPYLSKAIGSSSRNALPAVWITSCAQLWIVRFSEDIFVHQTKLGNFKEGDNVSFGVAPWNAAGKPHPCGGLTVITWLHTTVPT